MSFSNLILAWFTYFLCAKTMFKHIFGLIPVTHKDSGVQLNQDNRFWVIQLSKSIFPTKVWACAGYPVHSRHMSPFWLMFLLVTHAQIKLGIMIGGFFENNLRPTACQLNANCSLIACQHLPNCVLKVRQLCANYLTTASNQLTASCQLLIANYLLPTASY